MFVYNHLIVLLKIKESIYKTSNFKYYHLLLNYEKTFIQTFII